MKQERHTKAAEVEARAHLSSSSPTPSLSDDTAGDTINPDTDSDTDSDTDTDALSNISIQPPIFDDPSSDSSFLDTPQHVSKRGRPKKPASPSLLNKGKGRVYSRKVAVPFRPGRGKTAPVIPANIQPKRDQAQNKENVHDDVDEGDDEMDADKDDEYKESSADDRK